VGLAGGMGAVFAVGDGAGLADRWASIGTKPSVSSFLHGLRNPRRGQALIIYKPTVGKTHRRLGIV